LEGSEVSTALRLVLFGDGRWAAESLRRICGEGHQVVGVVLRRAPSDTSLAETARTMEIPTLQLARVNEASAVEQVRALSPDLGLSIAYNQIFRAPVLGLPRFGILNFHAGMLPRYRGRNVINWAILNGEREVGVTAHFVDEGIDTGDILLQRAVPVGWEDTYGDVLCRVVTLMPDLVADAVRAVAAGGFTVRPQPEHGTYFCGRREGDEWLDWMETSERLHNKVRAISRPGPGARTLLGDRMVTIWRAHWDPAWPRYQATPGQVVGRCDCAGVLVKTGDSTLLVREVQVEGEPSGVPTWPAGRRLGVDASAVLRTVLGRLRTLEDQRRGKEQA
jgi:methionyl-tRNA formyltransferase